MLFEHDPRARRWMVSHDGGKTWEAVPAEGPSAYMRQYERRHPRKKDEK